VAVNGLKRFAPNFAVGWHFALWGPLLGGVLFATLIAVGDSSNSTNLILLYVFAIVIAYVLGGVPAFFTGFILSFVRPSSAKQGALVAGLAGLLTSVLFVVAIENTSVAVLGVPGAFAGATVGFFYFRKKIQAEKTATIATP